MAPAAIEPISSFSDRDGHALEDLSDNIDAVNVLKAEIKEKAMHEASEFDAEKDKTQFRQYEEACDRVKSFYKELAIPDSVVMCKTNKYPDNMKNRP
jgi:inositol oxygenase